MLFYHLIHTHTLKLQFCSYQSALRDSVITAIPQHNTTGLTDGCAIFEAEHACIFLSFAKEVYEMCHMAGSTQMTKQSEFSRNTRWGCQKDANNSLSRNILIPAARKTLAFLCSPEVMISTIVTTFVISNSAG